MAKYIGVDFGGTHIKIGIVEFYGKKYQLVRENEILTEAEKGKEASLGNLVKAVESVMPKNKNKIKGIGIGFAGSVNAKKGVVNFAKNIPGWKNVELKKIIEKKFRKFGMKCLVDNDAKCAAWGEYKFGAGMGKKNIALITLGTGLGCGIILDEKIYYGKTGEAGEIGFIPILKNTELAEGREGGTAKKELEQLVNASAIKEISGESPSKLAYKAEKGDAAALKIFKIYGERVGVVLSVVANTFEPEMIIMGGGISRSFGLFEKSALKVLRESTYEKSFKNISIVKAQLKQPGVVGAAALFLKS